MKHINLLLISLLGFTTLFSCSNNSSSEEGIEYQTIVDAKNRSVQVKKEVNKICVTFNIEEYFAIYGDNADTKLVGWSHSYLNGRRNDAYEAYTKAYPSLVTLPDIGYGASLNAESILALNPDVVISSLSADYSYLEPQLSLLEKANIPVVFVDYHTDTIESIKNSNSILGKLLNREDRANEISSFYESKVSPIFERAKTIKDEDKPNVYMEFSKGKDTYGNTWSTKMWGSLIQQVGGNNIAYNLADANSVDMAKEAIIKYNPDVIILTGTLQSGLQDNVVLGYNQDKEKAKIKLASYLERSEWKDINAVKNRNLSAVYHDLSRHVFDFAGVEFLAKKIQPTIFGDLDPMKDLKEFFSKYMPFEVEGCFTVEL